MATQVPFNSAQNHRFKFILNRSPAVTFHMKSASIPSLSLPEAQLPTPFYKVPIPGDHINFEPFVMDFTVDENFQNYDEIVKWMVGLGTEFAEYKILADAGKMSSERVKSDGTLMIMSSKLNPRMEIHFADMWPSDIGEINFTHEGTEAEYATCQVTLQYSEFSYNLLA